MLGFLTWLGRYRWRIDRLQLGFDGRDISLEQVIEQAVLVGTQLLAALGKLVPFADGDLMSMVLVDRFEAMYLLTHRVDLGQQLHGLYRQSAQLFRCHLVEVGRGSHAVDCARAGVQRR
ncbi:hypothetical protein AWM69_12785 [Pseudomonas sp. D1HM]|nr:hypothetical protein [Pseudomonas sp. D1HM]